MKRFFVVFGILCVFLACSCGVGATGSSDEKNAEAEIRTALCEIENGNFKAAQSTLEAVLKKDPKNIYALRLLPGIAARQFTKGDRSPDNVALIRKAIGAYEDALTNPVFKNERREINDFIITLYEMIGREEKMNALLKKAENESEEPKQRAVFYTSLAADNYACANEISDVAPVRSTVKKAGKEVYVFSKPQNPADFEKLKKCAVKGSQLIGKAVTLDPSNDTARSYQAELLAQLARIAEMEGRHAEKARLMKEYNTARDKFFELDKKRRDEQAKIDSENFSKSSIDDLKFSISEEERKELAQELKSYRVERPLARTVDSIYIPYGLVDLVAPLPLENEAKTEPAQPDDENQTREWKVFSPEGGFSAELPANASFSSTSNSRTYTASGNGLSFYIMENTRSSDFRDLSENEQDVALNVIAWTLTKFVGNMFISVGKWNDRFESSLTRKDKFNGRSARFYAYRMISCKETREGTMLFVIGQKKNYAIDIRGAGESDERIQRFLKSLKLD